MAPRRNRASREPQTLFDKVADVTQIYFGDEAYGHIGRLIRIHLQKPAEQLTRDELISLTDWIRGTVSFLEDDTEIVEQYITELLHLSASSEDDS